MLHLGARALIATLIIAPVLAFLLSLSGFVAPAAAALAFLPLVFVAMLAGLLLLSAAGASDMPFAAAWALGAFATSFAVYLLSWCLEWTAAAAFAAWAAAVVAFAVLRAP